jgi:hypothetical protein
MPRCPNGSRKNKNGICTKYTKPISKTKTKSKSKSPKSKSPKSKSPKSKSPKSKSPKLKSKFVNRKTALNMNPHHLRGLILTKKLHLKPPINSLSSENTPRKDYFNKFFKNKKVILSNHKLFQVVIDINQFKEYVKISSPERTNLKDCAIQSLFSLGLRDRKFGKKDSKKNKGVMINNIRQYLRDVFQIPNRQIWDNKVEIYTPEFLEEFRDMINSNLQNSMATIIYVDYYVNDNNYCHAIIVYKYDDKVVYFDPQNKTEIKDLQKYFNYIRIIYTFETDITNALYAKDTTCNLNFGFEHIYNI